MFISQPVAPHGDGRRGKHGALGGMSGQSGRAATGTIVAGYYHIPLRWGPITDHCRAGPHSSAGGPSPPAGSGAPTTH